VPSSNPVNASPATESAPPARRAHPYRAFAIRAGLGFAVIAVLLWHYDPRPVLRTLSRENPGWFVGTVAVYIAGQVMSAYRWQLVAGVIHLRARFAEFLAYYFVGMFTNLFVPGLVGGDAARAIYLGRRSERMGESVASVVCDRGIGLAALFWLAGAMAVVMHSALPASVIRPTAAVGAAVLAGFLAAPLLARLIPYLPRPLRRAAGLVAPYMHRPQTLVPAIVLSLTLQVSLAVCQWMLARGLGLTTPLALFMLCVPIANVFASLPLTLNGLGIRESAYLVLFGMTGMAREDAIALGLLWFAATMLGGLTGAVAFISTPAPALSAQQSQS
jgi:glycosyltransferase 2 family protein